MKRFLKTRANCIDLCDLAQNMNGNLNAYTGHGIIIYFRIHGPYVAHFAIIIIYGKFKKLRKVHVEGYFVLYR